MKKTQLMIPLILLISMLLSSCTLSSSTPSATETLQPGQSNETLLQTVDALSTQSVSGGSSTAIPAATQFVVVTAAANAIEPTTLAPANVTPNPTTASANTPLPTQAGSIPVVQITPIATLSYSYTQFEVTHVLMGVDNAAQTVDCPPGHGFNFTADIQTNHAGNITYYWGFSDGTKSSEKMLNFSSASTQRVTATWNLGLTGPESTNPFIGWARIYIDFPNHQFFGEQDITLTCNSPSSFSVTPQSSTLVLAP